MQPYFGARGRPERFFNNIAWVFIGTMIIVAIWRFLEFRFYGEVIQSKEDSYIVCCFIFFVLMSYCRGYEHGQLDERLYSEKVRTEV